MIVSVLNGMAYCNHLAERRDATEDPKDADGLKAGNEAVAVVGSSDESYGDADNDRVEPAPWVGGEGKREKALRQTLAAKRKTKATLRLARRAVEMARAPTGRQPGFRVDAKLWMSPMKGALIF